MGNFILFLFNDLPLIFGNPTAKVATNFFVSFYGPHRRDRHDFDNVADDIPSELANSISCFTQKFCVRFNFHVATILSKVSARAAKPLALCAQILRLDGRGSTLAGL
jgi:hypothetical protein